MSTAYSGDRPRGKFVPPGYETRISAFMDVLRFGPTCLPGATFLALLFHVERSLPYGKAADAASLSQMTGGIRRSDGSWVRAGAGLKKSAAAHANARLEEKGLLKRKTRQSSRGGNQPTEYTVEWKALKAFFANVCNGSDTPLVHVVDKPLSTEKTTPLSTEWTHRVRRSSSQSKDLQSSGNSSKPLRRSAAPSDSPRPKPTPFSKKVDDDEKPKPENAGNRLKAWADGRGDPLSQTDWWSIKNSAEARGLSLDELAALAEKNDGNWKSSAAGLRWLIKQFNLKTSDAPEEVPTPEPAEKCPLCKCPKGEGVLLQCGSMEPCECATPEFRERIAQAIARDAAKASRPPATGEAA